MVENTQSQQVEPPDFDADLEGYKQEQDELQKDKKRMDWLLSMQSGGVITFPSEMIQQWCAGASWREAIDAQIKKSQE